MCTLQASLACVFRVRAFEMTCFGIPGQLIIEGGELLPHIEGRQGGRVYIREPDMAREMLLPANNSLPAEQDHT